MQRSSGQRVLLPKIYRNSGTGNANFDLSNRECGKKMSPKKKKKETLYLCRDFLKNFNYSDLSYFVKKMQPQFKNIILYM